MRTLPLLLALAVLAASCSVLGGDAEADDVDADAAEVDEADGSQDQDEPEDDGEVEQGDEDEEEEEEAGADEPPPEPVDVAPLTGEPVADDVDLDRPVAAVKLDNHPNAQPPVGLDDADIVLTAVIEGGQTRLVAFYHGAAPERVGPVRSAREADADLLPAFDPVVGISGGERSVLNALHQAGITAYAEGTVEGFERDPNRPAPHDLFVSVPALWAAAEELPSAERPWEIDDRDIPDADPADPPEGGDEIDGVEIAFSDSMRAVWDWVDDRDGGHWERTQEWVEWERRDEEPADARNVVIARVPVTPGTRTDASGAQTQELGVLGEGEALVLRDGRAYEARWQKPGPGDHFSFTTPDGDPLPLAAGRTWVELVPLGGIAELQGGDAVEDDEDDLGT
ncbi:DUF3048 domain-containing protein [Egibacter rhizosphaerae]|uniref:DUF3048 domain-containing protein n=1 Tax=Egibacter rhizosphaerae TaxID=1670831 RepID=UPI0013F16085|nr:DUF3048 domain-containing protein [Egibacter rhizosphaerae]